MKLKSLLAATALAALSTAAQAADYLPVGVQTNVSLGTVTGGGWTQCFSGFYGQGGQSISGLLGGCSGDRLMLAGRATGSNELIALAQADRDDVTFDTGEGNVTHNANGVEWYFSENYSWGFAQGGDAVSRTSCDTQDSSFGVGGVNGDKRLCWHTSGGNLDGGWRIGYNDSLNGSSDFERLVFAFNGGAVVPEPATWALMIGGFGLAGASLRRRRAATAA